MSENTEANFTNTIPMSRKALFSNDKEKRNFYIEILDDHDRKSSDFQLGKQEYKIGRTEKCDIQLAIKHISRVHAKIFFKNDEYIVEDLCSTNGLYLNGIKITKCILRDGDVIEIALQDRFARLLLFEEVAYDAVFNERTHVVVRDALNLLKAGRDY